MDVPIGRLTPETKGHVKYHLTDDGSDGDGIMDVTLYHYNGTDVLASITIDKASGVIAGTLNLTDFDIDHLEMDVYEQVFEPGDIIRSIAGVTYVAYGMSDDNSVVYVAPGPTYGVQVVSGDYERVGHVDPATLLS